MRSATVEVIREMICADSRASAAAMVAISAPQRAKITLATPDSTESGPNGAKPPRPVRLAQPWGPWPPIPRNARQATMKHRIAATLIEANQNSNSP